MKMQTTRGPGSVVQILCWLFGVWSGFLPAAIAQIAVQELVALEESKPQPVTKAPAHGTFYLLQKEKSPPYPFDPYYGQLPVFFWDGVFFVDDTKVDYVSLKQLEDSGFGEAEGGGMMMLTGTPGPPGAGGTSSGATNLCCNSLTNFVVGYQYSNNGLGLGIAQTSNSVIALTIFTTNTSLLYDLYGTTNMNTLALPQLGRTHWQRLLRATNTTLSFSWGETNWCERYFQLGTTTDDKDGDSLTDAYENLVTHTNPDLWDTDGDLMPDGWEWAMGLNPLANDASGDADGDGLTNLQEYFGGTNPFLADNFGLFVAVPKPGSNLP